MNLIDLVARKDMYALRVGHDLQVVRVDWLQGSWNAIEIYDSDLPQIVLQRLNKIVQFKSCPLDLGLYVKCDAQGTLTVSLENSESSHMHHIALSSEPKPLILPWPIDPGFLNESTTLSLHYQATSHGGHGEQACGCKLLVHRRLDRKLLLSLAKGRGVELGPGSNPQIRPNDDVQVEYVEESPREKWVENYDSKGKYRASDVDFSRYTIGSAWDLPQADASLDFIFSSHVFEHLANPIGHLLRWKSKLKDGGIVLAVVPDLNCTKDCTMPPSEMADLRSELDSGICKPEEAHYRRWAEPKGLGSEVEALIRKGVSIHVHYYTPQSMATLLEECVARYGFCDYAILQSRNHKDFYFVLRK